MAIYPVQLFIQIICQLTKFSIRINLHFLTTPPDYEKTPLMKDC